uniref:G_PROTEIN_RECEP_F1_2 domain-containing protein n=1 Tax=Rhabditophanes sp. KR3021 TaxID=114890 RepID=A0AC35UIP8_9BILA
MLADGDFSNYTLNINYEEVAEHINISYDKFMTLKDEALTNSVRCGETEEITLFRYFYISLASLVALIGVFLNLLLFRIFLLQLFRKQSQNTLQTLYPIALALLDFFLCCLFILIFGVDIMAGFNQIIELFTLYHQYIVPSFIFSKIVQLLIPYVLILTTFERYAWITKEIRNSFLFTIKARVLTLTVCVVMCVLIRGPSMFSITVDEYPNCDSPFRRLAVQLSSWAQSSTWYPIYDFQIMVVLQQIIPFVTLLILNMIIVHKLASERRERKKSFILSSTTGKETMAGFALTHLHVLHYETKGMNDVGNAVYSTLAICFSYLLCNGLHLILTTLERTESSMLKNSEDENKASLLYTYLGDSISVVYMLTSSMRIVIYYKCNPAVRKEVISFFSIARVKVSKDQEILTTEV